MVFYLVVYFHCEGHVLLVAFSIPQIHNMEPEHGNCSNSVNLEFHQVYSVDNCYSECRQKYLLTECGCREFYMPDIDGKAKDIIFIL